MESLRLLGFRTCGMYTGKGRVDLFLKGGIPSFGLIPPFLYYLFSLKEHTNIPNTPPLNSNKPSMTAPPQHKQRYYYIFWSIATLAVVCGQVYVASSYRSLADALRMTLL